MKKETLKYKLTNWLLTIGFAAVIGTVAIGNSQVEKYNKTEAYTVQKAQESVTFTKEELNNCSYSYLTYSLSENYTLTDNYILYNNNTFSYHSNDNTNIEFDASNGYYIVYSFTQYNFTMFDSDDLAQTFEYSLTIYSSFFAENMQKSVTLSASQLNNNTYDFIANKLNDISSDPQLQNTYVIYNNNIYMFDEFSNGDYIIFSNIDNESQIVFYLDISITETYGKWFYWLDDNTSFTNSITIYSTYIADNINAPFDDGSDIIGGITSGMGLISALATTFLNGFTGLFYVNGQLTNFAIYSLVMLGVAICFAVIKLCMNVLRSNTGA